jgi:hypothetical protein
MSRISPLVYTKGIIGVLLLIAWSCVLTTGIIMWAAPHGQGRGSEPFLLDLSRRDWGELHLYLALIAVGITIIHVIVDWKPFVSHLRHIVNAHKSAVSERSQSAASR